MKQFVIASFTNRADAEAAIQHLVDEAGIEHDALSLLYRDSAGTVQEADTASLGTEHAGEDATEGAARGATIGGGLGVLAGLAVATGFLPALGPIVAAGPLVSALGIGGALGTAVAGGLTGAAVGGVVGALTSWGMDEEKARGYERRVEAGETVVTVHADDDAPVTAILRRHNPSSIDTVAAAA